MTARSDERSAPASIGDLQLRDVSFRWILCFGTCSAEILYELSRFVSELHGLPASRRVFSQKIMFRSRRHGKVKEVNNSNAFGIILAP